MAISAPRKKKIILIIIIISTRIAAFLEAETEDTVYEQILWLLGAAVPVFATDEASWASEQSAVGDAVDAIYTAFESGTPTESELSDMAHDLETAIGNL